MAMSFSDEVSLSYSAGYFNVPYKLMTWGRRLYFSSEGSHATSFIVLKNPSISARFEPANFEFNGKHDNH
jgi:hypothetical protein